MTTSTETCRKCHRHTTPEQQHGTVRHADESGDGKVHDGGCDHCCACVAPIRSRGALRPLADILAGSTPEQQHVSEWVELHPSEICVVHESCTGAAHDCRTARGTVPTQPQPYEASLSDALDWAADCDAGDYLVEYSETGMTDAEDPGSRCGYGDDELDAIRRALAARDLTLTADDHGLVAQAVRS